jgi:hypothetical protein
LPNHARACPLMHFADQCDQKVRTKSLISGMFPLRSQCRGRRFESVHLQELVPEGQIFEERVAERWLEDSGTAFDTEDDLDLDLVHDVDFEL